MTGLLGQHNQLILKTSPGLENITGRGKSSLPLILRFVHLKEGRRASVHLVF
jgi:hypothetical protein